jgi:hypothetical protein
LVEIPETRATVIKERKEPLEHVLVAFYSALACTIGAAMLDISTLSGKVVTDPHAL